MWIKDWSVCLAIRFRLEEHVTAVIIAVGREALRALLSLMFEPRVIVRRGFSRAITGLSSRRLLAAVSSMEELPLGLRGAIIRFAREISRVRDFFGGKNGSSRGLD